MENEKIVVKRKPITYDHPTVVYVPVYQQDFDDDGELLHSPTFRYSMADATHDEQMAWSMNPDYVLKLEGYFKATTKPLIIGEEHASKS